MELEFRLAKCTTVHFKCIIKSKVVVFFSYRKNKERKRMSVQISKKFKKAIVSLSKIFGSKIIVA